MEIFDFHTHIYPDKLAAAAVASVGKFYNVSTMECDGRVDSLLSIGQKAGIARFLVCSAATSPKQVVPINRFIAEKARQHRQLVGFGTVHPDMENPEETVRELLLSELQGIKIHPEAQGFYLDDPKLFALCDMFRGKLPLLIHCGDYRYPNSHPSRLVRLLHNFPDLTVIAAHFGGWSVHDMAVEYLEKENCFLDCSSSFMMGPRRMKELIRHYGAERLLFGSDYPMWNPKKELECFFRLGLTDYENEMILQNNPRAVLKID